MDKPVVKELIQNDLTIKNLTAELSLILYNENRISEIKKDYADLKYLLSQGGNASAKAAKSIYKFVSDQTAAN